MKKDVFGSHIKATRERIQTLSHRAASLPAEHKELFMEALDEMSTTLEELQAAGKELTRQAEELESRAILPKTSGSAWPSSLHSPSSTHSRSWRSI